MRSRSRNTCYLARVSRSSPTSSLLGRRAATSRRPMGSPNSIPSSLQPSTGTRRPLKRDRCLISTSGISSGADMGDSLHGQRSIMQNTKYVVDYIVGSCFAAIPEKALAVARCAMQDCVGVALAGAAQPTGSIPAEWARKAGGAGVATVWGHNFKTSPHDAALVNGTAAHAL